MLINSLKIEDRIIHIYTLIMIKNKLKILDCTLRDGGYYTHWEFDDELVKEIFLAHVKTFQKIIFLYPSNECSKQTENHVFC